MYVRNANTSLITFRPRTDVDSLFFAKNKRLSTSIILLYLWLVTHWFILDLIPPTLYFCHQQNKPVLHKEKRKELPPVWIGTL